jgi:hypothetical protein
VKARNLVTAGLLASLGLGNLSDANADMYDGVRAPTKTHLDHRLTVDENVSYKPIAKYFGDDLFLALALPTVDGDLKAVGGGLGLIVDDFFGEKFKTIPALEYGIPLDGSDIGINPTIYGTFDFGKLTFDPRASYGFSLDGTNFDRKGLNLGLTTGIGLSDRFRVGVDVNRNPNGEIDYSGTALMVLEPGEQVLQTYIGEENIGMRYIFNIRD